MVCICYTIYHTGYYHLAKVTGVWLKYAYDGYWYMVGKDMEQEHSHGREGVDCGG